MTTTRSIVSAWGTTATERAMSFPCDRYLFPFDGAYFRAVEVQAPTPLVFRWLCQLRVAPYSYDWIDNFGHQSPRQLIPGMENLKVGQSVMTIFQLVEFEANRQVTILLATDRARAVFGEIAGSYVILPQTEDRCRLVVKLLVRNPKKGVWSLMQWLLPWGDLFMMRKQVFTLKHLAERQARDMVRKGHPGLLHK